MGCLMQLPTNKDSKTWTKARTLLKSIMDFYFVFGLYLLQAILINTSNLIGCIQGQQVDIFFLHKTSKISNDTLKCWRSNYKRKNLLDLAIAISNNIKRLIKVNDYLEFQDPKTPSGYEYH